MTTNLFQRLKHRGLGQWIVAIVGCWCNFTCGQAVSWPEPALPKLRSGSAGFTVTRSDESWIVTVTFLGSILSPLPAGYIMDKIGRKNTLHVSLLLAIASWTTIYLFHSVVALCIARILIGAYNGFAYTVVPALIGEVVGPEIRGSMSSIFGVMFYLGIMYESLMGMLVNYDNLSLASLAPTVLLFLTFFLIPESPYYHLMKGDREEAAAGIEWLKGTCSVQDLDHIEKYVNEQLSNRGEFIQIFNVRPYRKAFIIVSILGAIKRMAGLTLLFSYTTVTLPDSFVTAEQSVLILFGVWILGSFLALFVVDKFERRTLMFISSIGSLITMLAIAIWYFLRDFSAIDTSRSRWLPLICLLVNVIFNSIGIAPFPTLIRGELFPVNIKGKASALACITMAFFSSISVMIYQPLIDSVGIYMNFLVCAIVCALGAIFSKTYMIETLGKSLEEIQDILSEKKT